MLCCLEPEQVSSMSIIDSMRKRAMQDKKTIVLPEGFDERVVKAAVIAQTSGFANTILLGKPEEIAKFGIDVSCVKIVDPETYEKRAEYANLLYEIRKHKGMTLEEANKLLDKHTYFGTMMVKSGDCDGMVCGASTSTQDVWRPVLQIIKTKPGIKVASSCMVMEIPNSEYGENGALIFADCALNPDPTAEEVAEIAIAAADSARVLAEMEPRIAMLSYSTMGSGKGPNVDKMKEATAIAKAKAPELLLDGELQADAALVPSVAAKKCKDSTVAGKANVLIFPDLNAGNIAYKLVQRLAKAEAIGPISQGVALPVNDLSRGCSAEDVANVVAITAIQAQMIHKQ